MDDMDKYNVPASNVIRHYDVTGKICPNPYVYNTTSHTWDEFKQLISGDSTAAADSSSDTTAATSGVPYMVRVDIDDLNIRTGAGTNYAKTGEYTGKGTFTITEEKAGTGSTAGWGKLKSGAGWISLDYCTKITDSGSSDTTAATSGVPYMVRVDIDDLNIRTGAGTNYAKTGEYTGKGTFTITEEKAGTGSTAGWGKLKSGAGWISLDYCTKLA